MAFDKPGPLEGNQDWLNMARWLLATPLPVPKSAV